MSEHATGEMACPCQMCTGIRTTRENARLREALARAEADRDRALEVAFARGRELEAMSLELDALRGRSADQAAVIKRYQGKLGAIAEVVRS